MSNLIVLSSMGVDDSLWGTMLNVSISILLSITFTLSMWLVIKWSISFINKPATLVSFVICTILFLVWVVYNLIPFLLGFPGMSLGLIWSEFGLSVIIFTIASLNSKMNFFIEKFIKFWNKISGPLAILMILASIATFFYQANLLRLIIELALPKWVIIMSVLILTGSIIFVVKNLLKNLHN